MAIAREAGSRSKVAVWSKNPDVDPVGSCIGPKQMRINTILSELNGERIDLIKYSPEPEEFIVAALSPATVRIVEINKNDRTCRVAVPADQLSLMKRVLKDEYYVVEREAWLEECRTTKLWLLWEILFETDIHNIALLEARVYAYGSQIKETDYLHRDIFIWLVAFLNLVIK